MGRVFLILMLMTALGACGGSRYSSANAGGYSAPVRLFAKGPIQRACVADSRRASSLARCGCVQAVADQSLSAAQQRRGAKMFKDPDALQRIRQSDNARNERFWLAWKSFGQDAAAACSAT